MNEEREDPIKLQPSDELKKPVRHGDARLGRLLLIALAGIVVLTALVFGAVWLTKQIKTYVELNTDHTIHLTDTTEDQVKAIEIKGKTAVTITRRGDTYSVRELTPAVTSQSACQSAFANAATLLAEGIAAENVTDFTDFGLDDPMATVKITYTDKEMLLEIGDLAPASQHYYVRIDGGDTVYLMRKLIVDMYSAGISAYRDISGFAVTSENLAALSFEQEGETFTFRHYDKIGGAVFTQWQIESPERDNVDNVKTEELIAQLEQIRLNSFVKTARELGDYGLDNPERTLTLEYADGTQFVMALGDTDSVGNVYAAFDGSSDVYLVKGESLECLDGLTFRNLANEFANIIAINSVESLTMEVNGKTAVFTIDRSGDDPAYFRDGVAMDAEAFKTAFQAMNIVPINGFADGKEEGAEAALTLTYAFAGEEEPYVVRYLDASINNYTVEKNGSASVTVSKDDCAEMIALWTALVGE